MSYLKDTPRIIHNALDLVSKIVETDTDVSVVDLNLLENLNTNQSLNYIKLEQTLKELEESAQVLQDEQGVLNKYNEEVDRVEHQVLKLELLVKELDLWSKLLEERADRTKS